MGVTSLLMTCNAHFMCMAECLFLSEQTVKICVERRILTNNDLDNLALRVYENFCREALNAV